MQLESEVLQLEDGIVVVALKGRLTLGTRLSLAEAQINSALKEGATKLILDLEEVDYADSAGLGVLLHAAGIMRSRPGKLVLAAPNETLHKLFELTNTTQLLTIVPNRDAAIEALR